MISVIFQIFLRSMNGSYGLSIGGTDGKIYVTRLSPSGAAEKNGHIFLGDQLMTIGENSTLNCSIDQATRYLQNYPQQVINSSAIILFFRYFYSLRLTLN